VQPITPPTRATLILLTGVTVLTLNMFLPSLTHIAADFGVDYAMASFAVAGYLAITAVINLIAGPLSDRYGRRPVALGALVIYLFA
jgi:MFS family permease